MYGKIINNKMAKIINKPKRSWNKLVTFFNDNINKELVKYTLKNYFS